MRREGFTVIAVLLFAATTTSARAATITVTNGNDSGPGSLRQAIVNASPGDTINFAPSVTTVTLTSGELVIDKNLTITGPGADRLTVTEQPPVFVYFRIFNISSSTATISISGITISNGVTSESGAGILSAGVLTLTDCTISDNLAGFSGGFGPGGGVMNDHGTMTITGCTISNNQGFDGNGGGGVMNNNGTMTITDCTISNNLARQMGLSLVLQSSEGGGILNDGGSLIITNSTISGNTCSASNNEPFVSATAFGGGVHNSGSMTITNCTISGNSAVGITSIDTGVGGGISNGGDLQIASSTIAHNSATGGNAFGGGINGFEPTRTDSSIIALNSAPVGPDFTGAGGLQSTGYNIIGNNADAVIISQPTDQIGTPAAPIDPLLGPLADNGGPTFTHALQPGSPAINRGDPAAPPLDQRGYGRVGVPDVGAFEFNGIAPTPTATPTPTPPPTPTPRPTPPRTGGTVHGGGTIQTANGPAYFGVGVSTQTKGKAKAKAKRKAKRKIKGQFSYHDPARGIAFGTKKFSSLIVTGNRATLSGTAKLRNRKIRFTATFIDNGNPGTRDNFSISLRTGYSADNNLSTGNVEIF